MSGGGGGTSNRASMSGGGMHASAGVRAKGCGDAGPGAGTGTKDAVGGTALEGERT